jgi:NhaP-type Na+/H+ or K+/H+ antiporter
MQNTRLNTLVESLGRQISLELRNPWRRIALLLITLLFGVYLGISLSAIAGQLAYLDIFVAATLIFVAELINWLFYSNRFNARKSLWGEALNSIKIGVIYGLLIIAFMLGS